MSTAAEIDALRAEPALRERGLELGDVLGAGGTAVVYRARDTRHDRDVAVKVLHRNLSGTTSEARFAQEIRVAAGLRHPNVLPLFDSGALADGRLFAVMPVAAGRPLSALIREGPLAVDEAVRLARETAEALAYLHTRGFVHRDVKPENILVEAGHAVLTDFGLATSAPPPGAPPSAARAPFIVRADGAGAAGAPSVDYAETSTGSRLTQAGTALGTLPYMSPEALLGDAKTDTRSDAYALGVVLFEMLTGHLPFTARSPMELLSQRTRTGFPSVRAARPDVPAALEAIIERCTALEPDARYPSAAELASALESVPFTDASRQMAMTSRRRRTVFVLALLTVAAFGLVSRRAGDGSAHLDPNQVVIADLVNDSGDGLSSSIGVLAGDIITEAVTEGTQLRVVNADVALPSRLQRSSAVADSELARQTRALVEKTGSGLVITGAFFRTGAEHEVIAEVIDASSGRVLGVAGPVRAATVDPDPALRLLADSVVSILRQRSKRPT